ncbi:Cytochrome c [Caulifigura coniformis]|uniref:Cytochrome c n=1 Tax=Caulifigura coniformis TaxID=2527983 RepID=A0A517S859_9PLAN|nr:di-heme oxidoredictase family protein [Caulifigura coniformis]QDT52311.1 Cytochrome c [Caulifigura coniformis]
MLRRMAFLVLGSLSLAASSFGGSIPRPPSDDSFPRVDEGRELFSLNFARPTDARLDHGLEKQGNGLGPVFNAVSCVACHKQGGVGGSGDLEANVITLGVVTRPVPLANVPKAVAAARKIHPAFSEQSGIQVLHQFAVGTPEEVATFDAFRNHVLEPFGGASALEAIQPVRREFGDVTLELSQRNTTPLWGLGLIEKFRKEGGDAIRARIAREQAEKTPWITGRIPATGNGPGWYGWRAQLPTLDSFVRSACAIEMGLKVAGFDEPANPVAATAPATGRKPRKRQQQYDLTDEQCTALTSFIRSLPRPEAVEESDYRRAEAHRGSKLFKKVGCADCHVPDLGWVSGVYSDMLLHDMGDAFSDAQTAMPDRFISRSTTTIVTPYYNVTLVSPERVMETPTNPQQEWKTPPLWGVRDSYPYMHDGRAATLRDAVLMHGGEAERSAVMFKSATAEDQQAIITFLESLRAPAQEAALAKGP